MGVYCFHFWLKIQVNYLGTRVMKREDSYISSGSSTEKYVENYKKQHLTISGMFCCGTSKHIVWQWWARKTESCYTPLASPDASRGNVHKGKTTSNNHPHDCTSLLIESLCLLKMLGKSVSFCSFLGGSNIQSWNIMKEMKIITISRRFSL